MEILFYYLLATCQPVVTLFSDLILIFKLSYVLSILFPLEEIGTFLQGILLYNAIHNQVGKELNSKKWNVKKEARYITP